MKDLVIHFVRHGEVHNPEKVFYGRLPGFHLSSKGFEEAEEAGAAVASVRGAAASVFGNISTSALLHSPLLRTRETAEVLATSHPDNLELTDLLEEEPGIVEVLVPFHRQPIAELIKIDFALYSHGREDEGFETFPGVLRRVQQVVGRLARSTRHKGTQVVAVCHGDICLAVRLWAKLGSAAIIEGGPGVVNKDAAAYPPTGSVTTLVVPSAENKRVEWWDPTCTNLIAASE